MSDQIREGPASQYRIEEILANISIAEICLAYLLQFDKPDSLEPEAAERFPLAKYAATYWTQHARVARKDASTLHQLIMELFLLKRDAYANWIRLYDIHRAKPKERDIMRSLKNIASPLYYASLAGLVESTRLLLETGAVTTATRGSSALRYM